MPEHVPEEACGFTGTDHGDVEVGEDFGVVGEGLGEGLALLHAFVEVGEDFLEGGVGLLLGEGFEAGQRSQPEASMTASWLVITRRQFLRDGLSEEAARASRPGETALGDGAGAFDRCDFRDGVAVVTESAAVDGSCLCHHDSLSGGMRGCLSARRGWDIGGDR